MRHGVGAHASSPRPRSTIKKYAATNAGLLYTAKGTAAFLVPVASWLQSATGGWHAVFVVATIANLAVAATALFVVKPFRTAHHAQIAAQQAVAH